MDVDQELKRFFAYEPEAMRCPVPVFSAIRDASPVTYLAAHDLYLVTGRQEALEVFRNHQTFSSAMFANVETARNMQEMLQRAALLAAERGIESHSQSDDPAEMYPRVPPHSDPPRHTRQRRLIQPAFTAKKARLAEPMLQAIARDLIERFPDDGRIEVRSAYSDPLMVRFVLRELHCDDADAAQLVDWVSTFISVQGTFLSDSDLDRVAEARLAFDAYFLERIREVAEDPVDDVLSKLVHADIDGDRLTQGELLMIAQTLLVGGTETSSSTTTKAVAHLATDPELYGVLRRQRELLPAYVEETLRLNGPIQLLFRRTTGDTVLGAVEIPGGARVGIHVGAAGQDPSGCPVPTAYDLHRDQPHQVMFGYGAHYCAGAELARVQVRVALGSLLDAFESIELSEPFDSLEYYPQINLHRMKALRVRASTG